MKLFTRFLFAALAAAILCTAMTACYQPNSPTVIDPVDENGNTTTSTTAPAEDEPTGPQQPTVSDVFVLNSTELLWDDLKVYEHTMTGDNTAHFDVVANNGNTCALDVVIDFESGLVTEATISYGDMTQTLLTDDYFDLIDIIRAVNGTDE